MRPSSRYHFTQVRDLIIEILSENGSLTRKQIFMKIGYLSRLSVKHNLDDLYYKDIVLKESIKIGCCAKVLYSLKQKIEVVEK